MKTGMKSSREEDAKARFKTILILFLFPSEDRIPLHQLLPRPCPLISLPTFRMSQCRITLIFGNK